MKEIKLWNKENFFLDKYKINFKKVARSQTIQGLSRINKSIFRSNWYYSYLYFVDNAYFSRQRFS